VGLTILRQPLGHKLSDSDIDAVIIDDGQGNALVYTGFAHALNDGDYIYIQSNFDAYNGYKYVDSISYDSFRIKNSVNSDNIAFVQDADITYRVSVLNHGWLCVHLPIVYEIESDLYPVNGDPDYAPNTVISQSDENGYTRLELSAALEDPTVLAKIEFVGTGELAGVYKILTVYQPWSIVIDLAYSASNSFTGYVIVKYYDNYCVNVRVYAGLSATHRWESLKPIELAATLQYVPDADNKVKFDISEILRSYIETRNNLTLDTLPNNLDFMVSFYIQYFESYDVSDGEEVTTEEGDVTTDDFTGYAVNAKLPFKSESISHLSDYVNEDVFLARWLTLQDRPIAIVDRFFDLSFINQFAQVDLNVIIDKYLTGLLVSQETLVIENPGYGVIRVPITPITGTDEYCVEVHTDGIPASGGVTSAITLPALSLGVNIAGPDTDWTTGANPSVTLSGSVGTHSSDKWANDYAFVEDYDYEFTINLDHDATINMIFYILDSGNNVLYSDTAQAIGAGPDNFVFDFTAIPGMVKYSVVVYHINIGPTSAKNNDINTITATQTTPVIPEVPSQQITERICIDILEECESTFIPSTDDIRLTEDGDFRILET